MSGKLFDDGLEETSLSCRIKEEGHNTPRDDLEQMFSINHNDSVESRI